MTREQEIDALIAEKVMGWKWDESVCRKCGWKLSATVDGGCVPDNCSRRGFFRDFQMDRPPAFSTDPAASKRLRDKMRADGWEYEITARSQVCVIFERDLLDDSSTGKAILADTEEMAVALAALRAIGAEA